jgi:hypothetical protein
MTTIQYIAHDLDYFLKSIKRRIDEVSSVFIFYNHLDPSSNANALKAISFYRKGKDGVVNINHIEEWAHYNPGQYTAVIQPGKELVYLEIKGQHAMNGANLVAFTPKPNESSVEMEQRMRMQIELESEVKRLKEENAELQRELADRDTAAGKMVSMLEHAAAKFGLIGNTPVNPLNGILNGFQSQQQQQQQPQQQQHMPEIDVNILSNALNDLAESFGPDWIIRFAAKVKSDPNVVNLVKSYFQ